MSSRDLHESDERGPKTSSLYFAVTFQHIDSANFRDLIASHKLLAPFKGEISTVELHYLFTEPFNCDKFERQKRTSVFSSNAFPSTNGKL